MRRAVTRRDFLRASSVLGAAAISGGVWSELPAQESKSPNEKLNIAFIGVAGQAGFSLGELTGQNAFALCDIDDQKLDAAMQKYPAAKKYHDFRKLLDAEKTIDAVCICTPDHIHAPATVASLKLGRHVYCEKPLTHSVYEARVVADEAAKAKVATQMGTQIHAGDNYRRVVEIVQSGAIGKVTEVHTWVGKGWGGGDRPKETPEVPKHIHWDLWLGPAPERPYHSIYLPANWRRWWDFGGGTLGDMACHHMDLPFWALGIKDPLTVEAEGPAPHAETAPLGLKVKYTYAARGEQPAVSLTWHDGDKVPKELHGHPMPGGGNLFVGDKGLLFADYGSYKLFPEEKFQGFKLPEPSIPRSIGHHNEWIKACKEGTPTTCNFAYAARLTEAVLLGNVAFRSGQKIEWDAANLKVTNSPEANALLRREYRAGWTLG